MLIRKSEYKKNIKMTNNKKCYTGQELGEKYYRRLVAISFLASSRDERK
jgi:hypothetical protein